MLQQTQPANSGEDPLSQALERYALAEEKVGEARLAQDQQIQARFLAGWQTTLNTNVQFATKARNNVENSRLMLDSTKAKKRSQIMGRGFNPDDETQLSEEARAEIEAKEDEFVGQVEEAQGVMKNVGMLRSSVRARANTLQVLDTPEPLRNLADLIAAQLEYHKKAYEILSELAPTIDQLQVDQEASYRQSREGA